MSYDFGDTKSALSAMRGKLSREAVAVIDLLRDLIDKIEAYTALNNKDSKGTHA